MNDLEFKPIQDYDVEWQDFSKDSALSNLFDNFFGWVNDSFESRYKTLDEQRAEILKQDPSLDIRNLDDGYNLEVEKLNAIQQKSSRGFTIIDINPGLLTEQNATISIPYEFIFDGTNFMPQGNESITKNFRSVPIDIAGNFVKVEFITESNSTGNINRTGNYRPHANIKYSSILDPIYGESDLTTNQTDYSFDYYARNKVFISFTDATQKPHMITKSGDSFETYFNNLIVTLNIGAPKIRITIGFNSKKFDGPSNNAVNANLALTGAGRWINEIDTVMSPFCLTEYDNGPITQWHPYGKTYLYPVSGTVFTENLIYNSGYTYINSSSLIDYSLGYSVLWITRIRYRGIFGAADNSTSLRVNIYVTNFITPPIIGPPKNEKRVHTFDLRSFRTNVEYIFEPCTPIRVVIPNGNRLVHDLTFTQGAPGTAEVSWCIDGYSHGEILTQTDIELNNIAISSKYITDSVFLSDFNRVNALRDP